MINSKMIFRILGFLLLIETAMLLCCGGVSLFYEEGDLKSFLISSALSAGIGVVLLAIGKGAEKSLNRRDGYVIVSVAWVTFSLFGMLPYIFPMSPTHSSRQCPDSAVPVPLS